jgi:branched-chain amino acid transport system substrate-binding protein
MGGTITMQEALEPGGPDPGQLLEAIAGTEPQMLYYPLNMEVAAHVTHVAREIPGLREVALVGSHEMFTPGFLGAGGEAGVGTLVATVDVSTGTPGLREFVLRFEERHGGPPDSPFHIFAYDAANMILAAVEDVARRDDAGRLHIGRAALLERLYVTRGFPGLSGRLTCSPSGNCSNSGVAIYEVVSPDPDSWNPGAGPESNPRKIWP